jgi:hypothetical protein
MVREGRMAETRRSASYLGDGNQEKEERNGRKEKGKRKVVHDFLLEPANKQPALDSTQIGPVWHRTSLGNNTFDLSNKPRRETQIR